MNYDVGDQVKLSLTEIRNEAGALTEPETVVLRLKAPDGTVTEKKWPSGEVVRLTTASFYAEFEATEAGVWAATWETTGAVVMVEQEEIVVVPDRTAEDEQAFAVPWRPSTKQVAALIHARTIVAGGERIGDFTDATEPTGQEVERIIDLAVRDSAPGTTANPCTASLRADARAVAALTAAALVEISFWPEQTNNQASTFAGLNKRAEMSLKRLEERIEAQCGENEEGEESGGVRAQGGFDDGYELFGRDWPPPGWI